MDRRSTSWPVIAGSVLLLFSAVGLRLWRLGNVPGVNGDEAWYGVLALEIAQGRGPTWWTPTGNPLNPFYMGPLVLLHLTAEPSVALLRSVAVISGLIALAVNYWLCQKVYDQQTAIVSTLILAVLPINIAYSRFGWDASQSMLASVPVLYLSLTAAAARSRLWLGLGASTVAVAAAVLVHPTNVFLGLLVFAAGVRGWSWRRPWAALAGQGRVAFCGALALSAASIAWLSRGWLVPAMSRAVDGQQLIEFVVRFQRLLTGATIYQFIPDSFHQSAATGSRSGLLAAYDIAGLAALTITLAAFIANTRRTRDNRDSTLLAGWGASVAAFYLIAGPEALAPHWERYAIWLVAPTTLILARSAAQWFRQDAGRKGALVIAGALIVLSFYVNYFQTFFTTGTSSHQTFRTGPIEPKAAAIQHVVQHRTSDAKQWVVTSTWWTYWPLRYFGSGERDLEVVWADKAWSDPEIVANAGSGRVWVVEFAGSEEATGSRAALRAASASDAIDGFPAQLEAFTYDYAGRPVLWIARTRPIEPIRSERTGIPDHTAVRQQNHVSR